MNHPEKGTNPMTDTAGWRKSSYSAEELLDTALTALCAVEHLTANRGRSIGLLNDKIRRVHERAGLAGEPA
jgi:hypothetical protein